MRLTCLWLLLAVTGCGVLSQDDPYRVPRPGNGGGTTTHFNLKGIVEEWEGGPGSYFPGFDIEERARWPRESWPRGDSQSRAVLAELASREMDRGYAIILFRGAACPRCEGLHEIFTEMGVRAVDVDFSKLYDADGGGLGREVKVAMDQLDPLGEEPLLFLGTRLLGTPADVEAMFLTGELHARLRAYGHQPRTVEPINRAPVVRIEAVPTASEAARWSAAWSAGWLHPRVVARLDVTVLEARGLTPFSFSYNAIERKVVRGVEPTPGRPGGSATSNPFVEAQVEGFSLRTPAVPQTLDPVWEGGYNAPPPSLPY